MDRFLIKKPGSAPTKLSRSLSSSPLAGARKANSTTPTRKRVRDENKQPSEVVTCPFCNKDLLASVVQLHVERCGEEQAKRASLSFPHFPLKVKTQAGSTLKSQSATFDFTKDSIGDDDEDGLAGDNVVNVDDSSNQGALPSRPKVARVSATQSPTVVANAATSSAVTGGSFTATHTKKPLKPQTGRNAMAIMMHSASLRPRPEVFQFDAKGQSKWYIKPAEHRPDCISWKENTVLYKKTSVGKGDFRGCRVELELHGSANFSKLDNNAEDICKRVGRVGCKLFSPDAHKIQQLWQQGRRCSQFSPGILKSLMQKAVRRRLSSAAIFCATELLMVDQEAFYRRMPVVIIEDSILHPGLNELVWFMLALTVGYTPRTEDYEQSLRIVQQVCSSPLQDTISWGDEDDFGNKSIPPSIEALLERADRLGDAREATVIRAMLCRASFGGMKGDTLMLRRASALWLNRFSYRSFECSTNNSAPVTWMQALESLHGMGTHEFKLLKAPSIPIAGIDFHVSPWLMEKLSILVPGANEDSLRSAMWFLHSSINGRRRMSATDYAHIRKDVSAAREGAASQRASDEIRAKRKEASVLWAQMRPHVQTICEQFVKSKMLI